VGYVSVCSLVLSKPSAKGFGPSATDDPSDFLNPSLPQGVQTPKVLQESTGQAGTDTRDLRQGQLKLGPPVEAAVVGDDPSVGLVPNVL